MGNEGPPRIQRLPEAVVNRIAAGEIIQRPVSALKELLENSLDAGATQINIAIKEGGNKLLQIQDNGHGIQAEDLPLLCERHATSKLRAFEDLTSISTLGFRGEALASISYVAHVTVTTMTPGAAHGLRVTYRDGVMDLVGPRPCAAVQGTTILVEDLFYNIPTRKKALKSSSDEFSRILDMVGCYAIFKSEVGFTVKKQGESRADLHTSPGASRTDNIRNIHGSAVARNLRELSIKREASADEGSGLCDELQLDAQGCVTSADYSGKKTVLALFINGRPVECAPLKRAIEVTYATLLPKTAKPFIFLDLRLPGEHVDVNLHPTKREVGFLFQDQLIEAVCGAVEEQLTTSNTQRTFTQTQLPCAPLGSGGLEAGASDERVSTQREKAGGDHKLIRTDSRARTLDSFMRPASESPRGSEQQPPQLQPSVASAATAALNAARRRGSERGAVRMRQQWEAEEQTAAQEQSRVVRQRLNPVNPSELESIQSLLEEIDRRSHPGLTDLIRGHTYVGMADSVLALLQHGTRLYLANMHLITKEMFYQQVLARFEQLKEVEIRGSPGIKELALIALENEIEQSPQDERVSREEVAALIEHLLRDKADMLQEYFALRIDANARLCAIPQLIESYVPDMDHLPGFVLGLAREVDWNSERECFQGVAEVLSEFYSWKPGLPEGLEQQAAEGGSYHSPGPCLTGHSGDASTSASSVANAAAEQLAAPQLQSRAERDWTVQYVSFASVSLTPQQLFLQASINLTSKSQPWAIEVIGM